MYFFRATEKECNVVEDWYLVQNKGSKGRGHWDGIDRESIAVHVQRNGLAKGHQGISSRQVLVWPLVTRRPVDRPRRSRLVDVEEETVSVVVDIWSDCAYGQKWLRARNGQTGQQQ